MANPPDARLNVAAWIIVIVASLLAIQGVADGIPLHGFDQSWPDHARFHLAWATASKIGFCLAAATIALIPLRRAERWSWWVLLGFTVFGNLALIPAAIWQGSGPRAGAEIPIAITFIALIVAMGLSVRVGFPRSDSDQRPDPG
jgi:hypothetical protein